VNYSTDAVEIFGRDVAMNYDLQYDKKEFNQSYRLRTTVDIENTWLSNNGLYPYFDL
jgi:hypothetical protein